MCTTPVTRVGHRMPPPNSGRSTCPRVRGVVKSCSRFRTFESQPSGQGRRIKSRMAVIHPINCRGPVGAASVEARAQRAARTTCGRAARSVRGLLAGSAVKFGHREWADSAVIGTRRCDGTALAADSGSGPGSRTPWKGNSRPCRDRGRRGGPANSKTLGLP